MPQHITVGQFIEELQHHAEPQARFVIDDDKVEFGFSAPSRWTELVLKTHNSEWESEQRQIDKLDEENSELSSEIDRLKGLIEEINDEVLREPEDPTELTSNILKIIQKT